MSLNTVLPSEHDNDDSCSRAFANNENTCDNDEDDEDDAFSCCSFLDDDDFSSSVHAKEISASYVDSSEEDYTNDDVEEKSKLTLHHHHHATIEGSPGSAKKDARKVKTNPHEALFNSVLDSQSFTEVTNLHCAKLLLNRHRVSALQSCNPEKGIHTVSI
jgi:hypothetical protein